MAIASADLTERQSEMLRGIAASTAAKGYPPTVREIGRAMGIKSPNGVLCHVKALVAKGCITHDPNVARSFVLTEAGREAIR